jgi:hypothetical protein
MQQQTFNIIYKKYDLVVQATSYHTSKGRRSYGNRRILYFLLPVRLFPSFCSFSDT